MFQTYFIGWLESFLSFQSREGFWKKSGALGSARRHRIGGAKIIIMKKGEKFVYFVRILMISYLRYHQIVYLWDRAGDGSKKFLPAPDSLTTFWQPGCQVAAIFTPLHKGLSNIVWLWISLLLARACGVPVVVVRAVDCWQWRSGH